MQQPVIQEIEDGTHTLYSTYFNQYYHSLFGAKQESDRVFLEIGLLEAFNRFPTIRLLEIGFGTGLNALLSWEQAQNHRQYVSYDGLEAYPLPIDTIQAINLGLDKEQRQKLYHLHTLPWSSKEQIDTHFSVKKIAQKIEDFDTEERYNLVYYDAFAPESQPEMWTQAIFERLAQWMEHGGMLTTYCSKGYVQRNLKSAGFAIEKHPGPKRKREIIRAIKL